jgi:PAS domain S-box-containing protein
MSRYENRVQLAVIVLVGLLLLANLFTLAFVALVPAGRIERAPALLIVFVITLVISLFSVILLPRWLLRPYRRLVLTAERAPVAVRAGTRDESDFVLETFQTVVAQLQAQQRELERLGAQARERAASAEHFNERIIASVPSGLVAFDREGHATIVNSPALALLEVEGEAAGRHARELLRIAPGLVEMVERSLQTGELYRREEIVVANGANGRTRRLGVTVAPIEFSSSNGARGALCLLTDITEIMQLREQVALKRNLESLGEMSAGLAHEFKNSLATLHGYAQFLQKSDGSDRASAAALLSEVRNLTEMVTAFLNFARPQPLNLSEVALDELVAECAEEMKNFYAERDITLKIEGEFPRIRADERMLRQALLNLLRNAAEAVPEDKEPRIVTVRGARENEENSVRIEIEDTGEGIPADDLQRIFIPFFTTKTHGHGIGLALAHRVITEHNGTLTASNSKNGGAIFTIKIMLAAPQVG